ncbi:hypothetical protein H6G04_33270 [Calothrix membranacea FACHB-236]|nr:hypothetical protein [Calothrix membranacea FACHB-236]
MNTISSEIRNKIVSKYLSGDDKYKELARIEATNIELEKNGSRQSAKVNSTSRETERLGDTQEQLV